MAAFIDSAGGEWLNDHTWRFVTATETWGITRLGSIGYRDTSMVVTKDGIPLRTPGGRERRFKTWTAASAAIAKALRQARADEAARIADEFLAKGRP